MSDASWLISAEEVVAVAISAREMSIVGYIYLHIHCDSEIYGEMLRRNRRDGRR
jgi:hypothetical protein